MNAKEASRAVRDDFYSYMKKCRKEIRKNILKKEGLEDIPKTVNGEPVPVKVAKMKRNAAIRKALEKPEYDWFHMLYPAYRKGTACALIMSASMAIQTGTTPFSGGYWLSFFEETPSYLIVDESDTVKSTWRDSYIDGAFTDCTFDGTEWGVPFQMQANCIGIYNKDIFDEVGIDGWPETFTELEEDCKKLKDAGYIPIAMGNKDQWLAESAVFNTFAYRYIDQDWFDSLSQGKGAKFTDDQFVKALTDFQSLAQYFNEDMNAINQDEMFSLYYNKKAAMFFDGAWSIGTMIQNAPADVLSATHCGLMPAVEGEPGTKEDTASGAGWNYVISSNLEGDDLAAALAFLKAVTTGDYAGDALNQGFISSGKVADDFDMSSLQPLFAEYYNLAKTMKNHTIFDCALPAEIGSGALYADTQQLIAGTMTPEQMAEDCQNVLDESR